MSAATLKTGSGVDQSMRNIKTAQDWIDWVKAQKTMGPEVRKILLDGTSAATIRKMELRRQQQQRSAAPTAEWKIPTYDRELISEFGRITRALFASEEDLRNREKLARVTAEIRQSDAEAEDDNEDEEQPDLFWDVCPSCGGSDLDSGYDDGEVWTRCNFCNLEASREVGRESVEASKARAAHEQRMRFKGLRGF
jgi:hypothetical protein